MEIVTLFIVVMIIQMFISGQEVRKTRQYFMLLNERGNVLAGNHKSFFGSGTIVMFLLNDDMEVLELHIRKGITAFSKFKVEILNEAQSIYDYNYQGDKSIEKAVAHAQEQLPSQESR